MIKVGDVVEITFSGRILHYFVQPLPRYMTVEPNPSRPADDLFFHLYEPSFETEDFWITLITHHFPIKSNQLRKLSEEEILVLNLLSV